MAHVVVKNLGQVKALRLPEGWTECPNDDTIGDRQYLREFMAEGHDQVRISFFYRGSRVDNQSGKDLLKLLSGESHELNQAELDDMAFILRDASVADWFNIRSARTEILNKKKILLVEGTWTANGRENLAIFIDTDGTGTAVQEIHFAAPKADYKDYLNSAVQAIKSVEWK